jgi:hypothetical protein
MDVSFRMGSGELCASGHRAEEVADMGLGDDNNHIDSISKYNIRCIQYYKMKRLLYIHAFRTCLLFYIERNIVVVVFPWGA